MNNNEKDAVDMFGAEYERILEENAQLKAHKCDTHTHVDMLEKIFNEQALLQVKLRTATQTQEFRTIMATALFVETGEYLQETPWKPWKKQQELHRDKAVVELADMLHFWINLCLSHDITAKEIFNAYMIKNRINHERADNGY